MRPPSEIRLLVCGGRDFSDERLLTKVLDEIHASTPIAVLIHGAAPGADSLADAWAKRRGVPRLPFPADWDRFPKAAGPIRNAQMLREGRPEVVCAFPGQRGTADMVSRARAAELPVIGPGAPPAPPLPAQGELFPR